MALQVSANISAVLSGTLDGKIDEPILKKYDAILYVLQEYGKYVANAIFELSREVINKLSKLANLAGMGIVIVVIVVAGIEAVY